MQCKLLTARVEQWLLEGRPARILHLFEQICNLVNDRGEVIALASSGVEPGPFTMLLDTDALPRLDVHLPVRANARTRTLTIGSWHIRMEDSEVWNARPSWAKLRELWGVGWPPASPLPAEIERALEHLLQAIACKDDSRCQIAVRRLAGRGSGLTPTGDDVLMGVLYGLWVWKPDQKVLELMAKTAAPLTTSLSATYLRAAAAGEATHHWHRLANGEAAAAEQILAIGHTSGRDAWAGFIRTAKIGTRKERL